jgi:hypothetical protein
MNKSEHKSPAVGSNYRIYGAMALGLATAIAFRLIIIINQIEPDWVRPVWYFAVLGNFLFFYYRYSISRKRKSAVRKYRLIEKVQNGTPMSEAERNALAYLLQSIDRSPESINYLIISVFSIIAIMMDIALVYLS